MRHYAIEWSNGITDHVFGSSYVNALYVNGVLPSMVEDIVNHYEVYEN